MTDHLHATTQQLIREIERKDRRFRFAQSIFMTLLILGFIAGGWFAARAFNEEQRQREQDNAAVITAINQKLDEQSKQLQCIVEFFTIEDRDNRVITSVSDCFSTERTSLSNPQEGEQSPNFTQGPSGPALVINPQQPGPGLEPGPPAAQPTPQPEPEPEEPTERPPVEVLGIPVCVPLTGVCLRQ